MRHASALGNSSELNRYNAIVKETEVIEAPHVDIFQTVASCTYRGEDYLARDNGAVWRLAKPRQRRSTKLGHSARQARAMVT